jgi:N-formylglutamate amidohydrolase
MILAPPLVHMPRGDLPVVLSVPHSGRDYPESLLDLASGGHAALASLEDPFVDRLAWRAINRGIGAVVARTPRAAVDCNRAEDEIDPSVIEGGHRERLTARARGGLGIIPARTPQFGYLWRYGVGRDQLHERLEQAHRPYHRALEEMIGQVVHRFGCALLLDCHSMPPPVSGVPEIIFGDRRGRSSGWWVSSEALRVARDFGFEVGFNDPFAGGHVVERHGCPAGNVHALQLEIDRSLYLDPSLREPGPGFDRLTYFIETLAVRLGEHLLAQPFATAAE